MKGQALYIIFKKKYFCHIWNKVCDGVLFGMLLRQIYKQLFIRIISAKLLLKVIKEGFEYNLFEYPE